MGKEYTITDSSYPYTGTTVFQNRGPLTTRWKPPASCLNYTTAGGVQTDTYTSYNGGVATWPVFYVGIQSGGIPDPACIPPATSTPPVTSVSTSCYTYTFDSSVSCTSKIVTPPAFWSPAVCPEGYGVGIFNPTSTDYGDIQLTTTNGAGAVITPATTRAVCCPTMSGLRYASWNVRSGNQLICGLSTSTTILTSIVVPTGSSQMTIESTRVAGVTIQAPAIMVAWQASDSAVASIWSNSVVSTATRNYYTGYTGYGGSGSGSGSSSGGSSSGGSSSSFSRTSRKSAVRVGVGIGVSAAVLLFATLIAVLVRKSNANKKKFEQGQNGMGGAGMAVTPGAGPMMGGGEPPKPQVVVTSMPAPPYSPAAPLPANHVPLGQPVMNNIPPPNTGSAYAQPQAIPPAPAVHEVEAREVQSGPPVGQAAVTESSPPPVSPIHTSEAGSNEVGAAAVPQIPPKEPLSESSVSEREARMSRLQTLEEQAAMLQREIAAERQRMG